MTGRLLDQLPGVYAVSVFLKDTTIYCSVQEPRVDKFVLANLRSYLLSCVPLIDILPLRVFPRTQQRVMLSVGIELAILQLLLGVLTFTEYSYGAAG